MDKDLGENHPFQMILSRLQESDLAKDGHERGRSGL